MNLGSINGANKSGIYCDAKVSLYIEKKGAFLLIQKAFSLHNYISDFWSII